MTPDDVRNTSFTKSPFFRRGYDEHAVDAFVARIEQTLRGTDRLTAAEVRDVTFGKARSGQRGYHVDEVDAFLDLAQRELEGR
ncbi:DivIVA domain-containing protein [Amycolatopsis sp. YIM 10]|uniref:DivIVA domain-containing protein n=1 Tax=Amycolatopsis sp. YIM 10 TaxID=2653857 RepID=UPI00128FFD47|nr:DivIVA domain-containing protein [Amycolatopsis sp. YIM 10]QFU91973.1 Cell wall synthesis protein Wag31 [Amycolatopsis sp. YIM 10]